MTDLVKLTADEQARYAALGYKAVKKAMRRFLRRTTAYTPDTFMEAVVANHRAFEAERTQALSMKRTYRHGVVFDEIRRLKEAWEDYKLYAG
jgi:hypothetical protein